MKPSILAIAVLSTILTVAFGRIFVRVQTTMIGYEIGTLKTKEGELLEEKSQLKVELAKISTKKNLLNAIKQSDRAGDVATR